MRRGASEWLLLPLFLLPLLLGAGFVAWSRAAYFRDLAPGRAGGERLADDWLRRAPEKGEWLARRFGEVAGAAAEGGVPVVLDGFAAVVVPRPEGLGDEPWTFTRVHPAGLTSTSLADGKTRLAVEAGAPPADAGTVDGATLAFRALLAGPDLQSLRDAPLPAAAKRFLLSRWRGGGLAAPWADGAADLLDAAAALEAAAPDLAALSPGVHPRPGRTLLVPGGGRPAVLVPAGTALPGGTIPVDEEENRTLRLLFHADPAAAGGAGWAGRREAPVAGTYAFVFPRGDRWWEGPAFARWAGPAAGAVLLLLLLPAALFTSLRRRRRLDEARARFITLLAHDLRTPLTSLRLYAEMLSTGRAPEAERAAYLDTIARESARLTSILGNLLDLGRLERGARAYAAEDVPLAAAAAEAVAEFSVLRPERAADVRAEGPEGVAARADRTALARILGNLLDNAGKFTAPGTPIRVGWGPAEGGAVRLTVADEGPGVAPEDRSRLFVRYERGRAAERDGVPGTGLGLALVRELAEGMGGAARLLPSTRGAAFEIALPGGADGSR